jgi:membrane-associated phospholipid phosphatase
LALLYLFAELADEVHSRETLAFDAPILAWLAEHRTGLLTQLALFLDATGSIYLLGPMSLLITAWLWRSRRRAAVFLVLSMAGGWGLNLAAKVLVGRLRPDLFDRLSIAPGYSFPSGHTMVSTAFFLALLLISWRLLPRYRPLAGAVSVLLIFAVGASRSYLQVHYPSDVLAGWLLSGAWVLGLNSWFGRRSRRRGPTPPLARTAR